MLAFWTVPVPPFKTVSVPAPPTPISTPKPIVKLEPAPATVTVPEEPANAPKFARKAVTAAPPSMFRAPVPPNPTHKMFVAVPSVEPAPVTVAVPDEPARGVWRRRGCAGAERSAVNRGLAGGVAEGAGAGDPEHAAVDRGAAGVAVDRRQHRGAVFDIERACARNRHCEHVVRTGVIEDDAAGAGAEADATGRDRARRDRRLPRRRADVDRAGRAGIGRDQDIAGRARATVRDLQRAGAAGIADMERGSVEISPPPPHRHCSL